MSDSTQQVNHEAETPFDRFARFYDSDYRNYDDDLAAISQLAEEADGPILELGCGTGRVLAPLAALGFAVTGVDISSALLEVARAKVRSTESSARTTLLHADLRTFELQNKKMALAVCTSNTLMHLTTPADQLAVLQNAHRHLDTGGLLLIDCFNPDVARLTQVNGITELADQWVDEQTKAQVLKWCVRTVDWAEQLQDTLFIYEELFADGRNQRTVCPFTLRFLWRNEGELMLEKAGFAIDDVWGDFYGNEYDSYSEHLIFLARKK
ncbi:MAG: class I SAM-dependent methyltransferase [Caldilineaceae bacterium]